MPLDTDGLIPEPKGSAMTTVTEVISYEEILSDLQAIVEEFGADYVYVKPGGGPACLYAHDDAPGCIVGHLLARHGVSIEQLAALDQADDTTVWGLTVDRKFPITLSEPATRLLYAVQSSQDAGMSWGLAVAHAIPTPLG